MKKLLLRAIKLFILVLFPGLLFAQEKPDYAILLNSGKFTPPDNGKTITTNSEVFKSSLSGNKYYLTLQFKTLPTQEEKMRLKSAGIELIDYLPNLAYTAAIQKKVGPAQLKEFALRSIFQLKPEQKTVPALLKHNIPPHAIKVPGQADLTIITYEKLSVEMVAKELKKVNATVLEDMPMFRTLTVRIPQQNIEMLVKLPFIQWVEPIDAPMVADNQLGRTLHRVNVLNDGIRNLKGDSIKIGIWDNGEVSPHLDFSPSNRVTLMEKSQEEYHTTHVAGTIGGRGIINPKARGMAPNANIYSYNSAGNIQTEVYNAIRLHNLNVSNHSYGFPPTCGITGASVVYSSTTRSTDVNMNTYPSHLYVLAAGNSQTTCTGGWFTINGYSQPAKNNIVVANIGSDDGINSTSSFGPVADGRIKPEISAFGTNVFSTFTPLNTYSTMSGTSMASPGVAGSLALLVERYKQLNANALPLSSLIKGVVCNTAADLGNPGPDYKFGFGRINALAAVKALEQNRYAIDTVITGSTKDISITVPSGTVKVNVMLTWNDPAGNVNASKPLVNNLDLSVMNGATTTLPWILDPNNPGNNATRATDNISNIEQVTLNNPAAGTYTLRVKGTSVPIGGKQQYALTWEVVQPSIEIIYPNGGESFDPGKQETITWDNAGVTGDQTIQYSIDNGANWTTISSTIPATDTRYTWTIPTGLNTSTALIKVSSGTLSDQSNATFHILGTPVSLNASVGSCPGSMDFSWPAVTNATHYNLFSLNDFTGQWDVLGSNITGTTYTANGLSPNTSMWFTIAAKNNTTGSVSEKAIAINKTVSPTALQALGPISGTKNLCPGSQNITYSVPTTANVGNYAWKVPAGTTLVSGQGSNSIVVNYPASGVTGNISVYGMAGSCQTATEYLAISADTIARPMSAGDLTACDANPSPVLTATATVPSGFSVVWYNSATGGTPISNPILNAPGTRTYYAASNSNSITCESTVRTPVTLTINASAPATISASSTNICEGEELTLTANQGNTYSWNNGENTRSIKIRKAGSYSVSVTQANGCSNTSAATTVSVTPNPVVNLTASPYTSLQPGLTTTITANVQAITPLTYSWFKNGTVIPGETKSTLPVSVDGIGNYTATVTTSTGCSGTSKQLAITDSISNSVFIYPNPNQGHFQVRYSTNQDKTKTVKIKVYDARGALVRLQSNSIKQVYDRMDVDMSQYGKGVYWLLLQDENGKKLGSGRVVID